jgi:outer membrane protein assembly factor BamB
MQGGQPSAPTTGNEQSLDSILRAIDAAAAPKGVSAETWAALTTELKRLLTARAPDGKRMSIAPTGAGNAVSDLSAVSDAAGTQATLFWTEVLPGDCNNDGLVYVDDIVPLAKYLSHYTWETIDQGQNKIVGGGDGWVYALNGADGSIRWTYRIGSAIWSSAAISSDGCLYVGSGCPAFKVYAFGS